MTRRIRPIVIGTLATPVLVLLIVCTILVGWAVYLQRANAWVTHTLEVVANTNASVRLLIDQETGLRAYLLTSDPAYLAPYEAGRRGFGDSLSQVARLTADNPSQQERLSEIDRRYARWMASAEEWKRRAGSDPAFPLTRNETLLSTMRSAKEQMDTMRGTFAGINAEEERLLEQRQRNVARVSRSLIIGGVFFVVIASLAIVLLIRRQLRMLDEIYGGLLREQQDSAEREKQARTAAETLRTGRVGSHLRSAHRAENLPFRGGCCRMSYQGWWRIRRNQRPKV